MISLEFEIFFIYSTPLLLPDRKPSYNRWLAVVVALLLAATIVLAIFLAIEQSKTSPSTVFLFLKI
jgi:hypothetical protein